MTKEEKARAYDEALKCAKMYYKENKDYNAGFLPIIFPELAESEDERIRKAIVGLIEEVCRLDLKPCRENCPLRKTKEEMEQQRKSNV